VGDSVVSFVAIGLSGQELDHGRLLEVVTSREVDGSTLIAAEVHLPNQAWLFEQLTTVIPVTYRSWTDCLLTVVVPRPTQPSIPPGSVNEDQVLLGRQRQV